MKFSVLELFSMLRVVSFIFSSYEAAFEQHFSNGPLTKILATLLSRYRAPAWWQSMYVTLQSSLFGLPDSPIVLAKRSIWPNWCDELSGQNETSVFLISFLRITRQVSTLYLWLRSEKLSVEESQDLSSGLLSAGLLVIHNSESGC